MVVVWWIVVIDPVKMVVVVVARSWRRCSCCVADRTLPCSPRRPAASTTSWPRGFAVDSYSSAPGPNPKQMLVLVLASLRARSFRVRSLRFSPVGVCDAIIIWAVDWKRRESETPGGFVSRPIW